MGYYESTDARPLIQPSSMWQKVKCFFSHHDCIEEYATKETTNFYCKFCPYAVGITSFSLGTWRVKTKTTTQYK